LLYVSTSGWMPQPESIFALRCLFSGTRVVCEPGRAGRQDGLTGFEFLILLHTIRQAGGLNLARQCRVRPVYGRFVRFPVQPA
jgi:hypothetical protein